MTLVRSGCMTVKSFYENTCIFFENGDNTNSIDITPLWPGSPLGRLPCALDAVWVFICLSWSLSIPFSECPVVVATQKDRGP
jgi:hypothetical protein